MIDIRKLQLFFFNIPLMLEEPVNQPASRRRKAAGMIMDWISRLYELSDLEGVNLSMDTIKQEVTVMAAGELDISYLMAATANPAPARTKTAQQHGRRREEVLNLIKRIIFLFENWEKIAMHWLGQQENVLKKASATRGEFQLMMPMADFMKIPLTRETIFRLYKDLNLEHLVPFPPYPANFLQTPYVPPRNVVSMSRLDPTYHAGITCWSVEAMLRRHQGIVRESKTDVFTPTTKASLSMQAGTELRMIEISKDYQANVGTFLMERNSYYNKDLDDTDVMAAKILQAMSISGEPGAVGHGGPVGPSSQQGKTMPDMTSQEDFPSLPAASPAAEPQPDPPRKKARYLKRFLQLREPGGSTLQEAPAEPVPGTSRKETQEGEPAGGQESAPPMRSVLSYQLLPHPQPGGGTTMLLPHPQPGTSTTILSNLPDTSYVAKSAIDVDPTAPMEHFLSKERRVRFVSKLFHRYYLEMVSLKVKKKDALDRGDLAGVATYDGKLTHLSGLDLAGMSRYLSSASYGCEELEEFLADYKTHVKWEQRRVCAYAHPQEGVWAGAWSYNSFMCRSAAGDHGGINSVLRSAAQFMEDYARESPYILTAPIYLQLLKFTLQAALPGIFIQDTDGSAMYKSSGGDRVHV